MSLLTAQVIKRQKVGVDIPIPPKTIVPVPFLVTNSPPPEFANISSIKNWYEFGIEGNYLNKDYLYIRNEILTLIDQRAFDTCLEEINDPTTVTPNTGDRYCVGTEPVGDFIGKQRAIAQWNGSSWDFLDPDVVGYNLASPEEKEIAARLYIGLIEDHERDFDSTETKIWREEYHAAATETRVKRMLSAETLIQQELPAYQAVIMLTITSLVTEINATGTPQLYNIDFHKLYKDFGVKGEKIDFHPIKNPNPAVGIIDYFYGTSLFTGKGLIDMPFQPVNMTLQELCDRLYDILVLGNTLDSF